MRLAEPLTRKVPSISVAGGDERGRGDEGGRCTVFLEIEAAGRGECGGAKRGGDGPLCDDDGDVSPYVEVAVCVCGGYLDAGPSEGLLERFSKDGVVLGRGCCAGVSVLDGGWLWTHVCCIRGGSLASVRG